MALAIMCNSLASVKILALADFDIDEPYGFTIGYSGGDGYCGYLGTLLAVFSEGQNVSMYSLNANHVHVEKIPEVQKLYDNLPQKIKDIAPPIGTYIVWTWA